MNVCIHTSLWIFDMDVCIQTRLWISNVIVTCDVYIVMYKCSKLMRQITCLYFTSIWMIFKEMNKIHGTIQSIILKRYGIAAV